MKKKPTPSELAAIGFARLPEDAQIRVMAHVLSRTSFLGTGWGTNTAIDRHSIAGSTALACKAWNHVVQFTVNANTKSSIAPLELARIKRTAMALDLSGTHDQFYKACSRRFEASFGLDFEEEELSRFIDAPSDFLPTMLCLFWGPKESFCNHVELEYKRFMVLKAIETREPDAGNQWNTRCQPTCLIDEFWHAHMLQPCKYQAFCVSVLGELIDHEPGYFAVSSGKEAEASTTAAKLESTFKHDSYPSEAAGGMPGGSSWLLRLVSSFTIEGWKAIVLDHLADAQAQEHGFASDEYGYDDCG